VGKTARKSEKRNSARQIIEETRVCDFAASFFEDLNQSVLARANQPFRIELEIDESPNAANDVTLSKQSRKFLYNHADPPAIDFVESAIEKLKVANKMLRSFKLRIAIEEVAA
jgi:hypothetical protein